MSYVNYILTKLKKILKHKKYLCHTQRIISKWTINLNIKVKTIKLLEENMGVYLHDLGLGSHCLYITSKAQATKEKMRQNWTSPKLKTSPEIPTRK